MSERLCLCGPVFLGAGCSGVERSGVGWSAVEWHGVEWSGVEWSGVEWSGVEWSGVEWSGVEWTVPGKDQEGHGGQPQQGEARPRRTPWRGRRESPPSCCHPVIIGHALASAGGRGEVRYALPDPPLCPTHLTAEPCAAAAQATRSAAPAAASPSVSASS